MAEPRWLSEREQQLWRNFVGVLLLLPDRLSRDLQREHGMTHADYEILVHLSESPDRRLRMSELAHRTMSSKSRLSHQIGRMESAGLVERSPCAADRRGFWATLTAHGWNTLVTAAPTHVNSVREHLVDLLTPEQFDQLGTACGAVRQHLERVSPPG